MTDLAPYSREELRRSYSEAWRKRIAGALLTPLESSIADVVELHREYQSLIADPGRAAAYEPGADGGRENPFLHMGLHLAVREQVSVDRPPGIRELHRLLLAEYGDDHAAEHALMQALGETLWEAQRTGRTGPADERQYLDRARRSLASRTRGR